MTTFLTALVSKCKNDAVRVDKLTFLEFQCLETTKCACESHSSSEYGFVGKPGRKGQLG
jgi:hypothetical protein